MIEEDRPVTPQSEPERKAPVEADDIPEAEPDDEVEAPENGKPML